MKCRAAVISRVAPVSPAYRSGIRPGERVLEVCGEAVEDVLDFKFKAAEQCVTIKTQRPDGSVAVHLIEREYGSELGIDFERELFDGLRLCRNRCRFCFVDQLPRGMRESLYVKDDDFRLSFLYGNFITLTNLGESDYRRIISQRLSPLYVSVHATSPVRDWLLGRRQPADVMEGLRRLVEGGIELHAQIVVCPGINDGAVLRGTLEDLSGLWPGLRSCGVVPVGLTRFRQGLPPLTPFGREGAARVLEMAGVLQQRFKERLGTRFVFLADEFYLLAGQPFPPASCYEGFPQLENGIGLCSLMRREFKRGMARIARGHGRRFPIHRRLTVATGRLAWRLMCRLATEAAEAGGPEVMVYPIPNRTFGPSITVAGLLTGRDIISELRGRSLGDALLLPSTLLRHGEGVFLDDLSLEEVQEALGIPVRSVEPHGGTLAAELLGGDGA